MKKFWAYVNPNNPSSLHSTSKLTHIHPTKHTLEFLHEPVWRRILTNHTGGRDDDRLEYPYVTMGATSSLLLSLLCVSGCCASICFGETLA